MMEKPMLRTDLAQEAGDGKLGSTPPEGVRCERTFEGETELFEVNIETEAASRLLGKKTGRYLTLSVGRVWEEEGEVFRKKACLLAEKLRTFLPASDGCVLIVGLGNRSITADAIGPMTLSHTLVTRHLEEKQPDLFRSLSLRTTAAISPGVLGETGVESAAIVRSLVTELDPAAVIAVDALASRSLSRLATTVQISDAGISPGSGVGNRRDALSRETLGIPVIALGVPTVVDVVTLAWDVLQTATGSDEGLEQISEKLSALGLNFFVTPKETDEILRQVSALIGYGINLALHPSLTFEEMLSLVS